VQGRADLIARSKQLRCHKKTQQKCTAKGKVLAEMNEQAIEQQGMSGFTAISGVACWTSNMVGLLLQATRSWY